MTNLNYEELDKAKTASSVVELIAIAKESGRELSKEQAQAYFAQLNPKSGELADEELDNVAGGGACDGGEKTYDANGYLIVTYSGFCNTYWTCVCGAKGVSQSKYQCLSCQRPLYCNTCLYYVADQGICSNPGNRQ
jgi:hypothetical protein